ncbi:hypothetical protein GALL_495710 [mine drainage metagenome]|uniref:Uncharacterized protein n=1 Tax=mine drainage metagenome TaxID=410659 RepID=A0A1J5PB12_9ZZZZ
MQAAGAIHRRAYRGLLRAERDAQIRIGHAVQADRWRADRCGDVQQRRIGADQHIGNRHRGSGFAQVEPPDQVEHARGGGGMEVRSCAQGDDAHARVGVQRGDQRLPMRGRPGAVGRGAHVHRDQPGHGLPGVTGLLQQTADRLVVAAIQVQFQRRVG